MDRISELPAEERAKRYRELVTEANRDAGRANGDEREAFLKLASQWQRLAELAEQKTKAENKN